MSAPTMPATTAARDHQLRVMELAATWATAELTSALLRHDGLMRLLDDGAGLDALAATTRLPAPELRAVLHFLAVEDVVERDGPIYRLSAFGRDALTYRGWLDLYVRGYRGFFHHADELLAGDRGDGWRDTHEVGVASNAMSEHDAVPLLLRTIDEVCPTATRVLDVGCADGVCVTRLCELRPSLTGVGVEPDADSAADARRRIAEAGLADRVRIVTGEIADAELDAEPDVVIFSFVLQELVGQRGEAEVRAMLVDLGRRWPRATVIAVEVDAAGRDDLARLRSEAQRRGYYNLYFLVHELTAQTLLTLPEWRRLFGECGFTIAAERMCEPEVDDTDLTVAFALTPEGSC